uniref:Uncharacterized protein n=1 Tax=Arundo donax TaxID=35708 RepID=A0A0A9DUE7_ARUDO
MSAVLQRPDINEVYICKSGTNPLFSIAERTLKAASICPHLDRL